MALNAPKLDAIWLEKMRSAKLEQLRAHIAVLMDDHERGLASRDSAIQVHVLPDKCRFACQGCGWPGRICRAVCLDDPYFPCFLLWPCRLPGHHGGCQKRKWFTGVQWSFQALDRDLAEAEEHHQKARQGHGLCLNRLVELQAARLQVMEQRFEANLKARNE